MGDKQLTGTPSTPAGCAGAVAPRNPGRLCAIPRLSIHALCEHRRTAEALQAAAIDRRLARVDMEVSVGGVDAAIAQYAAGVAPDLLVVETTLPRQLMLAGIDRLIACYGAAAKVMVIGQVNDVALYRELLQRGISDYLLAPVSPDDFVASIASLLGSSGIGPAGRILAFAGAKGGVGSSTLCHNVAWAMSEALRLDVVVVDLDLAFGTAGLDFNQDPLHGIAEALRAAERLDGAPVDRYLTRCSQHLSILAAPLALDRDSTVSADACGAVLDALRQLTPFAAVDLPHAWTPAVKRVLLEADELVITATPDLANLRNAKNLVDLIRSARADGRLPHLVINMAGSPGRPDVSVKEFSAALDLRPAQVIAFDGETFGFAANNGQMIEEVARTARAAQQFRALGLALAHRAQPEEARKPSPLVPILEKLGLPVLARRLRPFSTA
jgi:pilus assembly protein CpaE